MRPDVKKLLVVFGTRPEAIKMAPVLEALSRRPAQFAVTVCTTGQHREMLDQAARQLGVEPDVDLALMQPDQSLNGLCAAVIAGLDQVVADHRPDWVLVQGDTTTALGATLAGFHRRVPVGHVEAGLRTADLEQPFPEEANRRLVDVLASALFAPTERAAAALRREGHDPLRIHVVGNTVVDALRAMAARLEEDETTSAPEVLITVHRRESFGAPLRGILGALRELARRFPEVEWVYPVHPNPNVRGPARELLSGLPNLRLLDPLPYPELVRRLARCRFVLTDSGGLQEEAPAFGKPVLVLRGTTERSEGIEAGVARLVGVEPAAIVHAASVLLTDPHAYGAMARRANPYGDGRAGERIAAILAGEPWAPFVPGLTRAQAATE